MQEYLDRPKDVMIAFRLVNWLDQCAMLLAMLTSGGVYDCAN